MTPRTHPTSEVYWVVNVKMQGDAEHGMPPVYRRYEFHGPDAAARAGDCYANALKADMEARAEQVRTYKAATVSA